MEKPPRIERHRAAIRRSTLSRPIQLALSDSIITESTSVFDYGCGFGGDIERLRGRGISCSGWDPVYRPDRARIPADVVNLGYVLNVIEDPGERLQTLDDAWRLTRQVLLVSVRSRVDARCRDQDVHGDGYITRINTFQKYYEQDELRELLRHSFQTSPVAAGPGVFYCFKNADERERFVAMRYRRNPKAPRIRKSDILYDTHRELLTPLSEFVSRRGRLPGGHELGEFSQTIQVFGSLKQAFAVIRRVTGREHWQEVRRLHREDLAIYVALAKFEGRPRFSELPEDLRLDVRALFSSYKRACEAADELLFSLGDRQRLEQACRRSPIGKQTPSALYVHQSVLIRLPGLLRAYEGCARMYLGRIDGADVIKLESRRPAVSYLWYPDFEKDPHPSLTRSLHVDLGARRVRNRDYRASSNPPILHRKEQFLAEDHPLYSKFARLTRLEESWGLYANPSEIGYRQAWNDLLARYELCLRGHRLVRAKR